RPDAAGAGADRDRHRLRDDGAVPGRAARRARPERHRSRRRRVGLMASLLPGLVIVPLVLPLMAAALLLAIDAGNRRARSLINIAATAGGLAVAAVLLLAVDADGGHGVYLAANWQA